MLAAALLVAGYLAAVAAVSGPVPQGTTVLGVDIGGRSQQEAVQTLESELATTAAAPIPVTAGETTTELDPAAVGLAPDWQATVERASGLILNPVTLVRHLSGQVEVEPETRVNTEALGQALDGLATVADVPATEPTITYSKKAVATLQPGKPGSSLDLAAATAVVAEGYLDPRSTSLALPMTTVQPTVSAERAEEVLSGVAQPAVAAPVTVTIAKKEVVVPARVIADALTFAVADGTLEPALDGAALRAALADDLASLERPGRDASFKIVKDKPVVVPSRAGRAVDPDDLSGALLPVLSETDTRARVATVAVTASDPEFTTADAKELGITEKLSSFRQWFPPAAYRYQNVGRAAQYLNGTIIRPGETFSMNDTVKERTVANGYTTGFIISGGRFREELGGGVSIITTATWTAGFHAGLERVEQHAHGLYISRYQAGLEATVAWGALDLRMRNDTGHGVLITATRYNDGVRVTMWGTKKYDKVTASFTPRHSYTGFTTVYDDKAGCVPSEGVQGFSIAVTRRLWSDGRAVRTETWPTTYKPTPHVICGPKPTPKPTPKPEPTDDTGDATQ